MCKNYEHMKNEFHTISSTKSLDGKFNDEGLVVTKKIR